MVDTWPHGYKTIFMLSSTEHGISAAHKNKHDKKIKSFLAFKLSDVVSIMLLNVKMSTINGILTFMSMISCMIS